MILEAERLGCVREVIVIAAALSLQDPRERPAELQAAGRPAARAVQGRGQRLPHLAQPVALPQGAAAGAVAAARSGGCASGSSSTTCGCASGRTSSPSCARSARRWRSSVGHPARHRPTPTASTRRCCPGCSPTSGCSRSATKDAARAGGPTREYLGARGARFAIFPGSGLPRKNPQFLMAGELVETSRLWARQNAAIKPEWAEQLGAHLVKRTYSEPHWSKKRAAGDGPRAGHAVRRPAGRRPAGRLRQGRRRAVAASCSSGTRWSTASGTARHRFLDDQPASCSRRPRSSSTGPGAADIVVDEHTLFDFYDARVGAEVVSGAHFDQWWKQERRRAARPAHLRPGDAHPRHRRRGRARPTTPSEWRAAATTG